MTPAWVQAQIADRFTPVLVTDGSGWIDAETCCPLPSRHLWTPCWRFADAAAVATRKPQQVRCYSSSTCVSSPGRCSPRGAGQSHTRPEPGQRGATPR